MFSRDLVFMHQPRDVEIFEGNDDTVTFMCNASSNGMCCVDVCIKTSVMIQYAKGPAGSLVKIICSSGQWYECARNPRSSLVP